MFMAQEPQMPSRHELKQMVTVSGGGDRYGGVLMEVVATVAVVRVGFLQTTNTSMHKL
jgi:hypothetical protein